MYLHKDATQHIAEHYMRFVQFLPSGAFYAIKWQVPVLRAHRLEVDHHTDQWVHTPNCCFTLALCARCNTDETVTSSGTHMGPAACGQSFLATAHLPGGGRSCPTWACVSGGWGSMLSAFVLLQLPPLHVHMATSLSMPSLAP